MSSVADAHKISRDLGDLLAPNLPGKIKIDRIYRALLKRIPDLSYRRARSFFFNEAARVDPEELQALKDAFAETELKRAKHQIYDGAAVLVRHHAEASTSLDSDLLAALHALARLAHLSGNAGGQQ